MKKWIIGIVLIGLVSGCGPTPKPTHRAILHQSLNVTPGVGFTLDTSSDCVEPGHPITFTLTMYAHHTTPTQFADTPQFDIILVREQPPAPIIARWSASSDYPSTRMPLGPTETRPYVWTWTPIQIFGVVNVRVQMGLWDSAGKAWSFDQRIERTGVGEGYANIGDETVIVSCAAMQNIHKTYIQACYYTDERSGSSSMWCVPGHRHQAASMIGLWSVRTV